MSEYRIAKVAGELNQSASALISFLNENGFTVENKPTTKITEDMYNLLLGKFSSSKADKENAAKLKLQRDLPKTTVPSLGNKLISKKEKETAEIEEKTKVVETPAPIETTNTVEKPVVETPAEVEIPIEINTPETEVENPVENQSSEVEESVDEVNKEKISLVGKKELVGPKVVGKIELKSDKPAKSKTKKEKETPTPEPEPQKIEAIEVPVEIQPPVVEEAQAEEETEEEIEKIETKFEKLSGPKLLGKIELRPSAPEGVKKLANDARDELREKRKRKRKDVAAEKVAVQEKLKEEERNQQKDKNKNFVPKQQVNQKDVRQNVRTAFNKMGTVGKNKGLKDKLKKQKSEDRMQREMKEEERRAAESKILKVTEFLTANELATMMNISVNQVISACFKLGIMVSINQRLNAETIQIVADDNGYQVEFVDAETQTEVMDEEEDNPADLVERPPIVTVMGHVDHGKTSLLDYIRKTNVIAGEAGGITQHIGAYEVTLQNKRKITFLDTPGHEAFTAMRARGARVTDLAIIVIAADDSVMPQTREAIAHAQAAGVPMIFAINKIDKDGAKPDRIREELSGMNILVEEWGGKYQCQEIAAKKGLNIDKLLEKVLLEADLMELKANPNRKAKGTVIEATLEKGRGIVCSLLVQTGTLRVGDNMVAGPYFAKVRALTDERGRKLDEAPPSTPVKMLGFSENPTAGDNFLIFDEEWEAKELANKRLQLIREQGIRTTKHLTLDDIGRRIAVGNFKELKLIVKGDVDGSVEALSDSLLKLSTEEIAVNVIFKGVGQISESDVLLAAASDAIIVGFQVRPSSKAKQMAEDEEVDIHHYSVIYHAIDEIKQAMEGLLAPEYVEKIIGQVEIREVFKISKVGTIAGCYVTDGKVERKSKVRVIRDGVVLHDGGLDSLKRFKDDVKEVTKGYECGLQIDRYNNIEVGDYLEVYITEEVKRKL